jgi:DNA-directed RNA polymerase specialized sigma24 family protein
MGQASESINWTDLLKAARANEKVAREELFKALEVRLRPVVQYRLRGWSDQDHREILQDTLAVVFMKLNEIDDNPDHFALSVLRNKIGDALRTKSRHTHLSISSTGAAESEESQRSDVISDLPCPDSDFTKRLEKNDLIRAIRSVIHKLPVLCQSLFTGMLEHRSIIEIWELHSRIDPALSRSTFDKRIFDCRKKLRNLMAEYL